MLPAEPNCSHSTRQSIHSRQLKSNFHSMRLAPDCELGERALHCDRSGSAQPGLARPSSEPLPVMGSNKDLTRRSVQEGTAVEVQRPSGARAMGYGFIGSYQSASGALPLPELRTPNGPEGAEAGRSSGVRRRSSSAWTKRTSPPGLPRVAQVVTFQLMECADDAIKALFAADGAGLKGKVSKKKALAQLLCDYGGPVARRRRAEDGEAEQTCRARRGREQDFAEISRRMYEEIRSSRDPRDHVEDG
ncbi:hypothetical protein EMIHUDRAFT_248219 [Emiliania huxleyi CCMP1516]|uniref:Uncharacterized protein n=2 Tax=Emiliania huxleyi TaxID=2903 RepID=A0A0D3IHQ7_EMIH1|nr:hypothetical protein EMIHUDRAFT_248219 [Emiliania huxleyi CCMP1516]EOD10792.1 hypothetical protein EMIHUDRAFT_248219 [Emiliania huxleyi CCMP1516]|eukprot:XP_005763221.1 hypothetical protein EMIHUDRAFT_248219 [Emiliania huxleyi CCMP1516]